MADYGRVRHVEAETIGDQVVGTHAAGVLVLQLDDTSEFNASGGQVYTSLGLLAYTASDPETDTLTLAAGLPAPGLADEAPVWAWDIDREELVTEVWASCSPEGEGEDEAPIEAVVKHELRDYLPVGIRTGPGEIVELRLRDDDIWEVVDLPGRSPRIRAEGVLSTSWTGGQRVELVDSEWAYGGEAAVEMHTGNSESPGYIKGRNAGGIQYLMMGAPHPGGAAPASPLLQMYNNTLASVIQFLYMQQFTVSGDAGTSIAMTAGDILLDIYGNAGDIELSAGALSGLIDLITLDGVRLGRTSSRGIKAFDFGTTTGSVSGGNGEIAVAHGLGGVPAVVLITDNGPQNPWRAVHADSLATSTHFTARLRRTTDNAIAPNGTNADFEWVALR